jgi:iron complex transport system substrate-binding protein
VAEILKGAVPFLGLAPKSLDDIYKDIMMIARVMGLETRAESQRGTALVVRMEKEVQSMWQKTTGLTRPLVYCEEWGKPLILSQTWVAELVEAAGGRFFGSPGKQVTEEEVVAADPDVIVAAWCGAGDRVPLEKIIPKRGWAQTKAAKNGRVYCINDEFLNTPASTLIQGLHALAAAIHPEVFVEPTGLRCIAVMTERT